MNIFVKIIYILYNIYLVNKKTSYLIINLNKENGLNCHSTILSFFQFVYVKLVLKIMKYLIDIKFEKLCKFCEAIEMLINCSLNCLHNAFFIRKIVKSFFIKVKYFLHKNKN